jgi:hypothetical protein
MGGALEGPPQRCDSVPRMRGPLIVLVAASLLVAGCANLTVGPSSPRPNVLIAAEAAPAELVLDAAISDNFVIPATASVNQVPVRSWRQTLGAGYHSAFPSAGSSGRRLELLEAELSFSPAAVSRDGTAAVIASIRFKSRLLDSSGAEVAKLAGTVEAREVNVRPSEEGMTDNAKKAVEALYEKLAVELLQKS